MSEVTRILDAIGQGEPHAAEQLLPLVYEELRRLAAEKLVHERPGQTLEATALVHEAYLRLVKLRYFAGLSLADAAGALGLTVATAKRHWVYARSWLYGKVHGR